MRALVMSPLTPPRPGVDVHGTYLRLRLHLNALHRLGASVETLYFVPETDPDAATDAKLDEAMRRQQGPESEHWGFPVSVTLVRRRARPTSFANEYLHGVLAATEQQALYRWAGPAQAAAVGARLDTKPDIVIVNNLHPMNALLRSGRRPAGLFFDLDDVQHRVRLRWCLGTPRRPGRLLQLAQVPALIAAERAGARLAQGTWVCSERDRAHLAGLGLPRVAVVPNAMPVPPPPDRGEAPFPPVLLFVGTAGHPPNLETAQHLVTRIMPLVRVKRPDARLLLAGGGMDALLFGGEYDKGVDYLGFVPCLAPVYARSRAFVCPMRNGGGTRIKLIDAAAHALPIVSSRIGAEGLDFEDGREILLRDDDGAFADACLRLLSDDGLCRRLGDAARAAMILRYDADAISTRVAAMVEAGLAGRSASAVSHRVV